MKRALWLLAGLLVGGAGPISAPYNLGVTDGTTSVQTPNKLVVSGGTITNSAPGQATLTVTGGVASNAAGTIGQLQFNLDGTGFGAFTLGGDATVNTGTGVLTIGHIGGKAITLGGAFSTGGALTFANLTTTGDLLFVSSSGNVGQEATTAITALGTITTGVWNGTAIANANLANSAMTIGGQSISLGGTTTNQGTGAKLQLSTGTTTTDHCVKFDAAGNTVDAGASCGSGAGNVSNVGTPTNGQLAQWTGATTIQGLSLGTGIATALGNTPQGNGTMLQLSAGAATAGDCVQFDANGNTVDAGAACGTGGGGSISVSDGTTTITGVTSLNFTNGTLSGATPAATLALGTAAEADTGTSGATVPLLNAANTWSGKQTLSASTTARASMAISLGTAPTVCLNGDIWATASGLFGCFGGSPVGPYGASGGSTTITLGVGLTNTNGTQNTGAQTIVNGSSVAPQIWPVVEAANHTATIGDGAGLYLANGASAITFTLPAATVSTANDGSTGVSYCFGDKSGHGYTVATSSAQVIYNYPGASGSATSVAIPASTTICLASDGTAWAAQVGATVLTGTTINSLSPASTFSSTDGFPIVQGSSTAVQGTVSQMTSYVLGQLDTYVKPLVQFSVVGASITLDYGAHNGRVIECDVASCTITLPTTIANLGTSFGAYVTVGSGDVLHLTNGGAGPIWVGNAGAAPITVTGPAFVQITTDNTNAFANVTGPPTTLTTGTSVSLTPPRQYYVCTGTCTVTPPVPAAGFEFCVMNTTNVSTVITLAALGSSARYENQARTAYGTASTGTFVSSGAVGDKACIVGLDATHYLLSSVTGTWNAN